MSIMLTLNSLTFKLLENVYEPAEDSFLLAKHAENLKGNILEIGCGNGFVAITNAKKNPKNKIIACDINEDAIKNSKINAKLNKIKNIEFAKSDLFSKINANFDHILFNPPYLPTLKNEKLKGKINLAYDGGRNGRKVIDRFIREFPNYLISKGSVLLIHSSLNNVEKTISILNKKGFKTSILEEDRFFFEKLLCLKITKDNHK